VRPGADHRTADRSAARALAAGSDGFGEFEVVIRLDMLERGFRLGLGDHHLVGQFEHVTVGLRRAHLFLGGRGFQAGQHRVDVVLAVGGSRLRRRWRRGFGSGLVAVLWRQRPARPESPTAECLSSQQAWVQAPAWAAAEVQLRRAGFASSSAMIRRIDARISSIEGSWTFAGCVMSDSASSTLSSIFYTRRG
jgi:hypothetical protein